MKNIWRDPKSGKAYYRSRRGGKLVLTELPSLPHDHPDFIAAWAAARKGIEPPPVIAGSIASTWRALLASAAAREWSTGYHGIIKRHADAICAKAGTVKAHAVRQKHVRADLDDAGDPVNRLKAWRVWGAWCASRGITEEDVTITVRNRKRKVVRRPPWTAAHKAAFRARWPIGTTPRALMELTNWTGARACDVVLLGPQMVREDGVLEYRQKKTGERAYRDGSFAMRRNPSEFSRSGEWAGRQQSTSVVRQPVCSSIGCKLHLDLGQMPNERVHLDISGKVHSPSPRLALMHSTRTITSVRRLGP